MQRCGAGTCPSPYDRVVIHAYTCLVYANSAFCVDDDQNQPLADWYGIVMGTSHEEPMMRSLPPEWTLFGTGPWDYAKNPKNVYDFWKAGAERARSYEGVFTMGMRGSGAYYLRASSAPMALTFPI